MKIASAIAAVGLILTAIPLLSEDAPAYVREGDRIEKRFREHRDRLDAFFQDLRTTIQREVSEPKASDLLREIPDAPPPTNIWGYGMLPRIVDISQPPTPITTFTYSWAVTEDYVKGETTRLDRARSDLARVTVVDSHEKLSLLASLVGQYRDLVKNQRTVDQYIQYNRFWQHEIAQDRSRFDKLTQVYDLMKSGNPATADAIRNVLGQPQAPRFVRARKSSSRSVTLEVRLYTDIDDDAYLSQARSVIEDTWRTEEGGTHYAIEIDFRKIKLKDPPRAGEHIDMDKHLARFPADGGVFTSGAQFTYGLVGRAVVLGPGDLAPRTLAHEFGHVLGFPDGYIRGYTDLGDRGFEILELTASFDDIMSAPREGHVQPTHFKLLMESLERQERADSP